MNRLSPCRRTMALSDYNYQCCANHLGKPRDDVTEVEAINHFIENAPPAQLMCCDDCPCQHWEGEDLNAPTVRELLLDVVAHRKPAQCHTPD